MDNVAFYMFTVYTSDGRRVELGVKNVQEAAETIGKREAELFGLGYTYKIWKCVEIAPHAK